MSLSKKPSWQKDAIAVRKQQGRRSLDSLVADAAGLGLDDLFGLMMEMLRDGEELGDLSYSAAQFDVFEHLIPEHWMNQLSRELDVDIKRRMKQYWPEFVQRVKAIRRNLANSLVS
jgi:hypothetical protein